MSAENVDVIRRAYQEFGKAGEIPWKAFAPDIEIRDHDLPDANGEVFRGREGYQRWVDLWASAWEEYDVEPTELMDTDDRVIAVFNLRAKGKGSGIETERENAVIYTVAAGKITHCDYYGDVEAALAAAGVEKKNRSRI